MSTKDAPAGFDRVVDAMRDLAGKKPLEYRRELITISEDPRVDPRVREEAARMAARHTESFPDLDVGTED